MAEVVVGTSTGARVLAAWTGPNAGLRCPDHPMREVPVRFTQVTRPDGTWKHKLGTGSCPECGWNPRISVIGSDVNGKPVP